MPPWQGVARDLDDLARLAARPAAVDDVLSRALDALADLVPYDLASVLELDGDTLRVRKARGPLARADVRAHHVALDAFPTVRRALETRRAVALTAHDHAGDEGDPYDGVLDLPDGHGCMVVPLFADDRTLGAITLDRAVCEPYAPAQVSLAGVVGRIVSLALAYADAAQRLDAARQRAEARARLVDHDVWGDAVRRLHATAQSAPMRRLVAMTEQVARSGSPALILGDTGTGKELVARTLHVLSDRADGPFIAVNGGALPAGMVEDELFGHVAGAFTGATERRPGRFLAADRGTLFLDEVAELAPAAQSALLRALQEGVITPVGSDHPVPVDVRVIAATHADLGAAVAAGRFREDLYYRLAVVELYVPPLAARREDLPALCVAILDDLHRHTGRGPWTVTDDALAALADRPWPGNVRALRNTLERATILVPAGPLDAAAVGMPASRPPVPVPAGGPFPTLDDAQVAHIRAALRRAGGRLYGPDGAAALLGMKPTTLQSRMKKLGVDRG